MLAELHDLPRDRCRTSCGSPFCASAVHDSESTTVRAPNLTLLRWYRRLVAKKYDGSARRGQYARRQPADIVQLVLRIAKDDPGVAHHGVVYTAPCTPSYPEVR